MKKLTENLRQNWPTYFFEILVLIIGIYGAFALESWNDQRKQKKEERIILMDIRANLEKTLQDLSQDTLEIQANLLQYKLIKRVTDNDEPYFPALDTAFGKLTRWSSPYITSTAYQALKSKGTDIISNRVLQNTIVNLFEGEFTVIIGDYRDSENVFYQTINIPYFSKNFRRTDPENNHNARPNDFESLKKDEEFKNILSMIIRYRYVGLQYYKRAIMATNTVITEIDKELKK
mgnify:CR=1 FL=1